MNIFSNKHSFILAPIMLKYKTTQIAICVFFFFLCISCNVTKKISHPAEPGDIGILRDNDKDGIPDSIDKCPFIVGVPEYNGCPIPDTDGDGVNDSQDRCPNTPGEIINGGCPVTAERQDSLTMELPPTPPPPPPPPPTPHITTTSKNTGFTLSNPVKPGEKGTSVTRADSTQETYGQTAIAYSFRKKLFLDQPRVFKVLVNMNNISLTQVKEELRKTLHEDHQAAGSDTSLIEAINYIGGKYYSVTLHYDPAIFKVDSLDIPSVQELSKSGNTWEWRVTGVKEVKKSDMTFKIEVHDDKKKSINLSTLDIPISVNVESHFPYKLVLIALSLFVVILIIIILRRNRKIFNKSIYFSYSWDDNKRTGIIDKLDKSLSESGFITVRDVDDLKPHGEISKFMTRIGEADFVIIGLSDKYIKSPFCIYELYEIYRNSKMDPVEFKRKIFPIRMGNLRLADNIPNYALYWKAEAQKLLEQQSVDFDNIKTITDNLAKILSIVDDVLGFDPDKIEKDDFSEVKQILHKAIAGKRKK